MSDLAAGVVACVVAGAHVILFVLAWIWAARSRHVGYLGIMVPATVAWSLAGFPLVRVLTYGTRHFGPPVTSLQAMGLAAILGGFVAFFVCAVGTLVTLLVQWASAQPAHR